MSGLGLVPFTHPFLRDTFSLPSPSRIFDQRFGTGLLDDEFLPPTLYHGFYIRPRRDINRQLSGVAELALDSDKFKVSLDVNQFTPEEITVKTVDNWVLVHGKHEEKQDDHGFISREFSRRYLLPEGVQPESVTSSLSQDGVLSVEAPRKPILLKPNERVVPIALGLAPSSTPQTPVAAETQAQSEPAPKAPSQPTPEAPTAVPSQPAPEAPQAPESPKVQSQPAPEPLTASPPVPSQPAPEAPKAPEEPKATEEAPKATEEAPKAAEAPKAPEASKAPEAPKAPEASKAPEAPKVPEARKAEAPKAPGAPKAP